MKTFQRLTASLLLIVLLSVPFHVHAQATILPTTPLEGQDCTNLINQYNAATDAKSRQAALDSFVDKNAGNFQGASRNDLLGCAIKTGQITLDMIPLFITYIVNFLLGLSALIAVLFIVIGGYHYVVGGLLDEKEKGKKTIMNALMGMAIALMAWAIVNVLMSAITG